MGICFEFLVSMLNDFIFVWVFCKNRLRTGNDTLTGVNCFQLIQFVFFVIQLRNSFMKLNKLMLAAIVTAGISTMAHAANSGNGKVTFTGAIIDAPCSITPESVDQTVDLGQVSSVALKNGGKSNPRPFTIDLENCSFEAVGGNTQKNKVAVTFTGMESSSVAGLLGITGTAQGAAVAITDGSGDVIKLGQPTKPQALQLGNNTLTFSAYLQGASTAAATTIVPGNFQSVADFTLAYN